MKTVLVVEDSRAEQQLISGLLQHVGLNVVVQPSAEDAMTWLENNPQPSLIVLDIIMPGQSGLDLCRQLREKAEYESLPIIFCSSKAEDFDRFWALRQGGTDYITKPFIPSELVTTVCGHLS